MKNLIKKNQLMITALAIMIAIAGYLQFAGTGLEEEYLTVNDDMVNTNEINQADSEDVISKADTLDGLLDLSEEDLTGFGVTDMDSMDSELESTFVEDYLDAGMEETVPEGEAIQAAEASPASNTPQDNEIPGEAVFTSAGETAVVLSEAKLLKEQTRARNKETLMEIINSSGLTDEQKQTAVDSMVEMTKVAEKEAAAEILLEAKGFTDVVVSINGNSADVVVGAGELDEAKRAQIEDIVTRKTEIAAENIIISTVSR